MGRGLAQPFAESCVAAFRVGSIGDRDRNTHKHSTTMITTSTFATEKPGPLAKIEAPSLDLWYRGKEAQSIFRAFKTLIVLYILIKEKIKLPQRFKKNQFLIFEMSGKNLTCWDHFLSISRN